MAAKFPKPVDLRALRDVLLGPPKEEDRSLRAFIAKASPHLVYPEHLGPYLKCFDDIASGECIKTVFAAPPQHGKTETLKHAILWLASSNPGWHIGYATYNQDRADEVSKECQVIADAAEMRLKSGWAAVRQWALENGSRVTFGGLDTSWTGKGFQALFVDDPFKGQKEARSPTIRDQTAKTFITDILTRQKPFQRTSYLVMATRWHLDDLSGRLIEAGWPYINLPAINERGEALWPEGKPIDFLRLTEKEMGADFHALFMGAPRAEGDAVFGEPTFYDALPTDGYRVSIGWDPAYTAKTSSDYNAAVVLYHKAGVSYVAEVVRKRSTIEEFRRILRTLQDRYQGAKITAFVAHTEKGSVEMLNPPDRDAPTRAEAVPAVADKYVRAQPVAAAWRLGKVLVPSSNPVWKGEFLQEVKRFTGDNDAHDDQVDALAGAFHPFAQRKPERGIGTERLLPF